MTVYRIKPLEKKSIYYKAELYRSNPNGTTSWFNVEETYRWGQGFINEEDEINLPRQGDKQAYCDPTAGWGAELDDAVSCWFDYSNDITDEEKEAIESMYHEGGQGWLHEGDHAWELEDDYVVVLAPFQVDLCTADGTVTKENIELAPVPVFDNTNNTWVFPSGQWPDPTPEEEEAFKEIEKRQGLQ